MTLTLAIVLVVALVLAIVIGWAAWIVVIIGEP